LRNRLLSPHPRGQPVLLLSDLSVAENNEFAAGQLLETHRPARMEFLR